MLMSVKMDSNQLDILWSSIILVNWKTFCLFSSFSLMKNPYLVPSDNVVVPKHPWYAVLPGWAWVAILFSGKQRVLFFLLNLHFFLLVLVIVVTAIIFISRRCMKKKEDESNTPLLGKLLFLIWPAIQHFFFFFRRGIRAFLQTNWY